MAYDPALIASFGKLGRTLPPKKFFDRSKILIQRTRRGLKRKLNAAYDDQGVYVLNRLTSIILEGSTISLHYLLGLLNSTLLDYYFQHKFTEWEVKPAFLKLLPIAVPEPHSAAYEITDQVATLARRMLKLHQRLAAKGEVHDNEREVIEREIATADREIDNLVYDLYGLTRKERALIESEASAK